MESKAFQADHRAPAPDHRPAAEVKEEGRRSHVMTWSRAGVAVPGGTLWNKTTYMSFLS